MSQMPKPGGTQRRAGGWPADNYGTGRGMGARHEACGAQQGMSVSLSILEIRHNIEGKAIFR